MAERLKVTIGIPTFQRPKLLRALLNTLSIQEIDHPEKYRIRILIYNNGRKKLCAAIVKELEPILPFEVELKEDTQHGLSSVRQKIVDLSRDEDVLVFIDDDETASPRWLTNLLETWQEHDMAIVAGPVFANLDEGAPWWVIKSRMFDSWKPYKTGTIVSKAYTNNVLISMKVFDDVNPAFDPYFNYIGSEDVNFFQRAQSFGHNIVWCQEAAVYEYIPQARMSIGWLARRSYNNGSGDTMSRLRVDRSFRVYIKILVLAGGRFVSGLLLGIAGVLTLNLRFVVKGFRRIISSIGTLGGITGYIGEDYR